MKRITLKSKKIGEWKDGPEKVKHIEFEQEFKKFNKGLNFQTLEEVVKFMKEIAEKIDINIKEEEIEKERVENIFGGLVTTEYKNYTITKKVVWDNRETRRYHFYIVVEVEFYNKKTHYHPKLRPHKDFIKAHLRKLKHEYLTWKEYKAENDDYSPITAEEVIEIIEYLKENM